MCFDIREPMFIKSIEVYSNSAILFLKKARKGLFVKTSFYTP